MARGAVPLDLYTQRGAPRAREITPARPVDESSGLSAIGRALSQAGQTLDNASETEMQIRLEQRRREEDDARVYVAQNMARVRQQANQMARDTFANAPDGWRGATDGVGTGFKSIADGAIENAPTDAARAFMGQALSLYQSELLDQSAEQEQTARQQWRVDGFTSAIETSSSVLAADPGQYDAVRGELLEPIRTATDLSADQRRDLERNAEGALAVSAMSGMVERDPRGALALLRDPDAEGAVARLDGQQRNALENRAQAELNRRESEARARQEQARASLRDTVSAQIQLLSRGIVPNQPLDVGQVAALLGPDVAQNYLANLASASAAQSMAPMSLAQVAQVAAGAVTGEGDDTQRLLTREARTAAQGVLTARREDPGGYALQNGMMRHGDLLGLLTNATQGGGAGPLWDTFDAALRDRGADAVNLRRTGVTDRVAVLSEGEAAALSQFLSQQPAQQRLAFFSRARASMNPEAYLALMGQIAPEGSGPVTALAGAYYGRNNGPSRTVAQTLLRGEEILRGGAPGQDGARTSVIDMPGDSDLRREWRERVGQAYEGLPVAEEQAFQAFRAYYAGSSEQAGADSDAVDSARVRDAANVATGGVVEWAGRRTLLPFGVNASEFEGAVTAAFRSYGARPRQPRDEQPLHGLDPRDYELRALGGGRYTVFEGDQPLRAEDGLPVVIRVQPQR